MAVPQRSTALGTVAAFVTAAAYLPGSGRAFDYDGSVTVANFVRTKSLLDPFRRQVVFNNHPAFSFIEHVVYSVTGSTSSWAMRVLPIGAAAACVGLLVCVVARRLGPAIGVTAGALLATNPVFLETAREVRGYSLVCLCGLAATVLLLDLERSSSRAKSIGYVAALTLGLATHLYTALVLLGHVTWLWTRRRISPEWRTRWLVVTVLGLTVYLGILAMMVDAARGRVFRPEFPTMLAGELLGRQPVAVAITAAGVAVALWRYRTRRETRSLAALYVAGVVLLWLLAPRDLFPRFFVWSVPAVALAAAVGLTSIRLRALVLVAALVALLPSLHGYRSDLMINRVAAPYVKSVQARGGNACGIGFATETLPAYVDGVHPVARADQLGGCAISVAVLPKVDAALVAVAERVYPHRRWLRARIPGVLFWR